MSSECCLLKLCLACGGMSRVSILTVSKNIESQSSPAPANDGASSAEDSAIRKFSLSCHLESQHLGSEATKQSDQAKVPAEKLFLGRMADIALNADKGILKTEGQAKQAWNKLFNPECFREKTETEPQAEASLCLKDNIYGKKVT
jgi:hypothetical protein